MNIYIIIQSTILSLIFFKKIQIKIIRFLTFSYANL
jgi:hypothetical protein